MADLSFTLGWIAAVAFAQSGGVSTTDEGEPPTAAVVSREGSEPSRARSQVDGLGVPLVSYNSDLGWGVGAVGGAYFYSPGYEPYRHALAAQAFLTTEGIRNHWIRYDGPRLLGEGRLELRLEYRRELRAPFYGTGNQSSPGHDSGVVDEQVSFDQFFPGGWARYRFSPIASAPSLEGYVGYGFHFVRVRPYEGSALVEEGPLGLQGGAHGQAVAGLLWDTRDEEGDPKRGGVEEIAIRASGAATLSKYDYVGVTLSSRRYVSLGTPKLILAQRLVVDAVFGDAPFFALNAIGGTQGGEGIGGMSSVRGVPRNRYVGKVKALSNTELRFYPFQFPLFGEPVKVGGVAFFDIGRVWHEDTDDGDWNDWHPGAGVGLRVVRRAAVLRLDVAVATETGRRALYVTFGHLF